MHKPTIFFSYLMKISAGLCLLALSACAMRGSTHVPPQNDKAPSKTPGQSSKSLATDKSEKSAGTTISICSFNIQFLGSSRTRDCDALANVVQNNDIVVVQELVAPPIDGHFPDGAAFHADPESAAFVTAMHTRGFDYWMSEEDTGTGDVLHRGGTATEWFITFYKPNRIKRAEDIPHGFLADDRSNHPDYERVPYAFSFRTSHADADFVLISVHLKPDPGAANRDRRQHELKSIASWVTANDKREHDFIILGDMNIENLNELNTIKPEGWDDLNNTCLPTNTNVRSPKPYDHVLYRRLVTAEIARQPDFHVLPLADLVKSSWTGPGPFPGGTPYNHDAFRARYTDHNPVVFHLTTIGVDDD